MWDTWLCRHDGIDYLYYLHTTGGFGDGVALARSGDGVHWEEYGEIIPRSSNAEWLGSGAVWPVDDGFAMNFSEMYQGRQTIYISTSQDLIHWKRGTRKCLPDPRWYDTERGSRWDCFFPISIGEEGYRGYLTASPLRADVMPIDKRERLVGMVESTDGINWRAAEPPLFDCPIPPDIWFPDDIEVGGASELSGIIYLLLCSSGVQGDAAGAYVFKSANLEGPFVPDFRRFALLASRDIRMTYFPRFYDRDGKLLVNHHSIARSGLRWMAPLKQAALNENGSLELRFWPGNEQARGTPIPYKLNDSRTAGRGTSVSQMRNDSLLVNAATGIEFQRLTTDFRPQTGAWIDAVIRDIRLPDESGGIGFLFGSENDSTSTVVLVGDQIIRFYSSSKNILEGLSLHDEIPIAKNLHGNPHLRILVRDELMEVYFRDLLIQCFSLYSPWSGRIYVGGMRANGHLDQVRLYNLNL